eukprot:5174508-Amphidinium_carterae.1
MSDVSKAKFEIDQFIKDNPTAGRKRLLDFASWRRMYGARLTSTIRQEDEQCRITAKVYSDKKVVFFNCRTQKDC